MATEKTTFLAAVLLLAGMSATEISGAVTTRSPSSPKEVPHKNGDLIYLGFFVPSLISGEAVKRSTSIRAMSHYFISQNAAPHATAETDCKAFLGEDATLLYVETQEELGNVTAELRSSDNTASSFWTGGKYDPSRTALVWGNNVTIGPWAPWDQGQPSSQLPVTRVLLEYNSDVKFRTEFQTVSRRYICELRTGLVEEEADPCYNDNDLVIVIDSSGSIPRPSYAIALEFTLRLALAWADNPKNRLSLVVYSNSAQTVISLGQRLTVSQLRDTIYKAPYMGGGTASDLGLGHALKEFQQNSGNVPRNLVFLTDGASNDPNATADAAKTVQNAGVRSFAVGIGSGIQAEELLTIAAGNPEHVFNTEGFADLLKLLQPVSRRVCP